MLDSARDAAINAIKSTLYFNSQVLWLQSRFPQAALVDVPGLCRVVTRNDIDQNDSSLTPSRYVGLALPNNEEEEEFEERLQDIHIQLAGLNEEAAELAKKIQLNFEELLG
ncbi:hypothetical protein ACEYW6_08895 [Nostoc sp. UIC 10607]|uniref:hypothetical protein n=1 Tax=Nostoc sp. UIC 10607 TaxID=3045935 RepID=UPI0039A130DB